MAGTQKTNALRLLDKAGISYRTHSYDTDGGVPDGLTVAGKIGMNPDQVFKTLVAEGIRTGPCVFVIPVNGELDLKKAARAAGEKSLSMLRVAALEPTTGYVRGGCSPFGMKKRFPTFVDLSALGWETIIVSAGRVGLQAELAPQVLESLQGARYLSLTQTVSSDEQDDPAGGASGEALP
jgi:Cys-tRNA(Pro)/Cys-tRNA(Cys) deacylase